MNDSVEARLERDLHRAFAMPAWSNVTERVTVGVQRRLRRQRVVRLAGAGLAVVTVLSLATTIPRWLQGRGDPSEVPTAWVAAPIAEKPFVLRREPRVPTRLCNPTDLSRMAWTESQPAASGRANMVVLIGNKSDSRCTLSGQPTITAVGAPLKSSKMKLPESHLRQYPATIDPGEPARVTLSYEQDCARRPSEVSLQFAGRSVAVSQFKLSGRCKVHASDWYVQPPMINHPHLLASLHAPTKVRPGEQLDYKVTLKNLHNERIGLHPCPTYVETLATRVMVNKLNCAVTHVAAGKEVTLLMKGSVPSNAPAGETTLEWVLVLADGRVVAADLDRGGAPLSIQ